MNEQVKCFMSQAFQNNQCYINDMLKTDRPPFNLNNLLNYQINFLHFNKINEYYE